MCLGQLISMVTCLIFNCEVQRCKILNQKLNVSAVLPSSVAKTEKVTFSQR